MLSLAASLRSYSRSHTPRGPGSSTHNPHVSAPVPLDAFGSPNAETNLIDGYLICGAWNEHIICEKGVLHSNIKVVINS